jgi:2-hydroxychromene-2-carboxylate isomerase
MGFEPDHRKPKADKAKVPAIDWDNLESTYTAPGALEIVPDMPPIADVTTPAPGDNWTWEHDDWGYYKPNKELPRVIRDTIVTEENPLKVDVFYSMRSPYSYLSLFRLAYLHSNYNVDVNIKVIFPIAVRTRKKSGHAGSGRWYYYGYSVMDARRTGKYEGIPFRYANPDPILEDVRPQGEATMAVAPMDKQPWITWLVRMGNAAQLQGKSLEYCLAVSPLIWGGRSVPGEWPFHVEDAVNSVDGLNYDQMIADIRANPQKYDDVWAQNSVDHQNTGQGGVPEMESNGEPFFGQDRLDQLFWRLRENGLTKRKYRREPMVSEPLRWPKSSGGE